MSVPSLKLRHAIRERYAWPGGYPMYLVMEDGEALCMNCGRNEYRQIVQGRYDRKRGFRTGWHVEAVDINWEDPALFCCHCNQRIESAYAEDQVV